MDRSKYKAFEIILVIVSSLGPTNEDPVKKCGSSNSFSVVERTWIVFVKQIRYMEFFSHSNFKDTKDTSTLYNGVGIEKTSIKK